MKKRIFTLLLTLCTLVVLATALSVTQVAAAAVVNSGTCGATGNENNVTWSLDSDGTMTISGPGAMADYNVSMDNGTITSDNRPWANCIAQIKKLVIEDGVTSVGEYAFYNTGLTSLTFRTDVTLGTGAFEQCKSLKSIIFIGKAGIGRIAFVDCDNLTNVFFFGKPTSIDATAFKNCSSDLKLWGYTYDGVEDLCTANGWTFAPLNGDCGNTMIWNLAADGTLNIQGSGEMYDYSSTSSAAAPWKDLVENGLVTRFVIEKEITYESLGITPKYTVVICDGTGDGTGKDVLATYVFLTDGEKVPKPTDDPERTGYKFLGWYAKGSKYYFDNTVSSDLLITAVWEKPDYIDTLEKAKNDLEEAVLDLQNAVEINEMDVDEEIEKVNKAITNLQNALNGKADASEITSIQDTITSIQDTITSLKAKDDTQQQKIDVIIMNLSSLQSELTTLKNKVTELEMSIGKLQTAQTVLENALTNKAGKDELKNATDKLDEVIAQLETLKTNLAATDAALTKRIDDLIGGATGTLKDAEDRLAALESEVADLGGQITNLENAQKRLEDVLATKANAADVTKNVNALHDEIAKLNTALSGKVSQTDYDALEAAVSALQSAVATLNAAKDDYKGADAALEDRLNEAIKDANDAKAAAGEELQKAIDALEAVKDDYKGADEELEKRLTTAIETAKAAAISAANDALKKAKTELNEAINKKADATALADAITNLNTAIATAQSAAQTYADGKDETMNQAIANVENTLKGLIDDVQENLDKAIAELNKAITDGDKDLADKITALNTALEVVKTALEKADADNKTELNQAITDAENTLKGLIDDVQKNLDKAITDLNKAISDAQNALQTAIDKVASDLANAKAELEAKNSDLDAKISHLQNFITVVCVIACISLAGNIAIVTVIFILKRKH